MTREYSNQNNQINPFLPTSRNMYRNSGVTGIFAAVTFWIGRRATRKQLARLSNHELHDIGISRADAMAEATKPFWRD